MDTSRSSLSSELPAPPEDDDAELRRVMAVLETRMLGAVGTAAHVGRFAILERVGAGGMGVVYGAYDDRLDRRVAIKLLHASAAGDRSTERIVAEARSMARLSHANVATVYEIGEHDGRPFVAMEYIRGLTLRRWRAERQPAWTEVLDVYLQAAEGLAAAHDAGLVHRDFKPDNAMIDGSGTTKVLDFGLARPIEGSTTDELHGSSVASGSGSATPRAMGTATRAGTPAYMSPEQLAGEPATPQSDQFAFCVTLHEALFGERPFAGKSAAAIAAAVMAGEITTPARSDVPPWLRRVIARGLSVDPTARFPSMRALVDALRRGRAGARRRRGFVVMGAIGVTLFGVAGWRVLQDRHEAEACRAEAERISEIWNPGVRDVVDAALLATGADYASDTAAQVGARIDAYATAWKEGRARACEADRATGEVGTRIAHASEECFEQRRYALETLLDVLKAADTDVLQRAAGAMNALPPVDRCRDPSRLLSGAPPPADPETRGRVTELRSRLTRAATLESAGRYDDAFAEGTAVLADAREVGHDAFVAEVLARVGTIDARRGNAKASEEALEESFLLAGKADDDLTAADAASELVWTVGYEQARYAEGLRWGRIAEVFLTRHGDAEDVRTAALLDSMGSVRDVMGAHAEAIVDFERALSIREHALGPTHPLVGGTVGNLGIANAAMGNMDVAVALQRRALAIHEAALGPRHPFTATPINSLANLLLQTGRREDALAEFRRALSIREAALGHEHPLVADLLGNIGNVEQELGNLEDALALQRESLAIYERTLEPDHPLVGRGCLNLGSVEIDLEMFAEAVQHERRALAIRTAAYPTGHPSVGPALYYLGVAQIGTGDHEGASATLQQLLAPREGDPFAPDLLASAKFHLARARWELESDRPAALALAREAQTELSRHGPQRTRELEQLHAWLAERRTTGP